MPRDDYTEWDRLYAENPPQDLPWETGRPRDNLIKWISDGSIPKGRALDICCGAGLQSIYMAKKGFEVACLDISSHAIGYARERAKKAGVEIDLHVQNFLDLPFGEGEFDFVFDSGCFHHVKEHDRDRFVGNLRRILRPGGAYYLLCFSDRMGPAWNHFSEEQILDLFSDGFEVVHFDPVESIEGDGVVRYFLNFLMYRR